MASRLRHHQNGVTSASPSKWRHSAKCVFYGLKKIETATKAQNCLKKKTVTVDRHSVKFENVLSELILGVI
jgi:hypothetical protein